ncbi:hypothetical protein RB195_001594 [Necator americanus]|uniref:Uncharacterized protein n=1 Tax=Necator americanus TaxID=51031 RepID=A0ABR1DFF6_NECAM
MDSTPTRELVPMSTPRVESLGDDRGIVREFMSGRSLVSIQNIHIWTHSTNIEEHYHEIAMENIRSFPGSSFPTLVTPIFPSSAAEIRDKFDKDFLIPMFECIPYLVWISMQPSATNKQKYDSLLLKLNYSVAILF